MTNKISKECDGGGDTWRVKYLYLATQLDFDKILSQLRDASKVEIVTYSFGQTAFLKRLLDEGKYVTVVINPHSKNYYSFINWTSKLSNKENLSIYAIDNIHSKLILADNNFVYAGSQNMVDTYSFENIVIFHDRKIYEYYHQMLWQRLCSNAPETKSKHGIVIPKKISGQSRQLYCDRAVFRADNVKAKISVLKSGGWATGFNSYYNRDIIITTLTIPNPEYANKIIQKQFQHENRVTLVANSLSSNSLKWLKAENPSLHCYTSPNIHAKMVLVDGKQTIVWSSSQNLGFSNWRESSINLKASKPIIYDFFKNKLFNLLEGD